MGKGQLAGIPNWLKENATGGGGGGSDVVITLLDTAWEFDNATSLYKQVIELGDVTVESIPVIGLLSSDDANIEAYSHIVDAETGEGTITFYADEVLSVAINVVVKGLGANAESNVLLADIEKMTDNYNEVMEILRGAENSEAYVLLGEVTSTSSSNVVTLNDDVNNYDTLLFMLTVPESNAITQTIEVPVEMYKTGIRCISEHWSGTANVARDFYVIYKTDTTANAYVTSATPALKGYIYGIKDTGLTVNMSGGGGNGTGTGTGDTIVVNSGEVEELLWTNPNLSVDFQSQTVALDLSGYSRVRINARIQKGSSMLTPYYEFIVGTNGSIDVTAYSKTTESAWRGVIISSTGIAFNTAITGTSEANDRVIPYQIYGVKEVDATHILNPNEDGWKLLGSATGTTAITLPDNYSELMITSYIDNTGYIFSTIVNKDMIENGTYTYLQDGFAMNYRAYWTYTSTSIALNGLVIDSDMVARAITTVYYRDNGGVTISKKDVYSTEEREVGTDVDGSPIYEKTYYSDSCNITATTTIDETINASNVLRVIEMKENYYLTNRWEARSDAIVDNLRYCAYCVVASAGVRIVSVNQPVSKYHITIRYVKA